MKIFVKIILVLVGLFMAVTLLGLWGPKVAGWWRDYQMGVEARRAEEAVRALETARANDRDGGKTPEETLELFLVALKDKNTLQASKYYEVSVQPKILGILQTGLAKSGNLDAISKNFLNIKSLGVKRCFKNYRGADGCSIQIPNNGPTIEFEFNVGTSVWKIIQPF